MRANDQIHGRCLWQLLTVYRTCLGHRPLLSRIFPGDFVRGRVPSDEALFASTALFVVISIFSAWLCARFAPGRADRHVLWFFILGEVMGIAATIPNWNKRWPHWYWLSWLLSWPISCLIGAAFGTPEWSVGTNCRLNLVKTDFIVPRTG